MRLLSLLGTGNYSTATYVWESREYQTNLFPEALIHWLNPKETLVLLTKEAEQHPNWARLRERATGSTNLIPVPIPSGSSEQELWGIFDSLTSSLAGEEEVVFDITHGFRSLPIVTLLAAAYLRVAQAVKLKHLLYGAFEARVPLSNPAEPTDRAPVFDLTSFLSLLDWTAATDQFLRTGNAQALANLLSASPPLQDLASNVQGIAQGLHLLRPMEVMVQAAALPGTVAAAEQEVPSSAPPFAALLKKLEEDYGRFGLIVADNAEGNAKESLKRQLLIAQWYLDKGQVVHGLALMREWVVSLLCCHFNLDHMENANRSEMECLLTGGKRPDGTRSTFAAQWTGVPEGKALRVLWTGELKLAKLRNDVLHAGFRRNPQAARDIARDAGIILGQLRSIAGKWGLEETVS